MQTGPAPRQSMPNWLAWTGGLEIINIAIFGFVLWRLDQAAPELIGPLSLLGFGTLSAVLFEGGLYWLFKRVRSSPSLSPLLRLRLLQSLYVANAVLLLIFPLVFIIGLLSGTPSIAIGDAFVGLGLYIFGLGEFVHYFVWKINMRGNERRRQRQSTRRIPARFRRELIRAQRMLAK